MEKGMNLLLGAFITLILGIVLLSVYADMSAANTNQVTNTQTNILVARDKGSEHVNTTKVHTLDTATNTLNNWRVDYSDCIPATIVVKNSSGALATVTTDYTYTATTGAILFKDTVTMNGTGSNATTISYAHCPDGYLPQSWSRSLANIAVGLFALLCLAAAVGFMLMALKEMKA